MDYTKALSQWGESLEYFGWAEWLLPKKRETKLFGREIIESGKHAKTKWSLIAGGEMIDLGFTDCAYCVQFREQLEKDGCPGCPIEYFTNGGRCLGTPYYAYLREPTVQNAKAMKDFVDKIFIKSLLLIDWRKYYEMPSM